MDEADTIWCPKILVRVFLILDLDRADFLVKLFANVASYSIRRCDRRLEFLNDEFKCFNQGFVVFLYDRHDELCNPFLSLPKDNVSIVKELRTALA